MNIDTLLERLEITESLEIEVKSAQGGLPESLWETVGAFANTSGGLLLLGVTETKSKFNIEGIKNAPKMKQDVFNLMRNAQKISLEVCGPDDIQIEPDWKDIIVMRVRAASTKERPVHINGNPYKGTFVRRNEGDYRCTKQEVDRMIRDASVESADSAILKGYSWKDLDKETFKSYRQRFREFNQASPWNAYTDARFLAAIGGYRKDRETEQEGITRAAVLMFGMPEAFMGMRPRHLIDFRIVPLETAESDQRWEHRIAWEGNLYDAFFKIYPRLVEPLKTPFKLSGPHRLSETPAHEALREALVNLLAHADYAEQASLLVKASSQEFMFRNPGSSRVSEEDLLTGDRSDPRNPILLRMFRHVNLAEEAGTGLPKILRTWRKAGLKLPSLTSDTERYEFKLTLKLVHLLSDQDRTWLAKCAKFPSPKGQPALEGMGALTEQEQMVLIHARTADESVNNASVQALTGLHRADVTDLLTRLRNRGLLIQESSRRWATYKVPGALRKMYKEKTIKKNLLRKPHVQQGVGKTYQQKPVSKTHVQKPVSKTERLKNRILLFCQSPRSSEEIALETGKYRHYLVAFYLTPMVKEGLLAYTNPAYPPARNQKYVAVPDRRSSK
ncbi:MAG: hypothetical protein A3G34_13675 [Candidatus Lindowbacteria bacterium RIFCSPLOWO2_12_FULL_62_27]|nr:MAG: hypothetical protein A3I06_14375 [Candidatus Lindowbacteria bacterium RIFCSPLOWO2_02_FULL_62_12]OGH62629.1 MAG: hypothetical protein A3G34_13675 [Candidatus Lindowbacteria bacterium RIFCSPLOWO2_12_FULL_62_27]